jgi:ribulose-5-phosphate 4-epimerase/fuculose-1-phosphate aldolase
MCAEGHQLVRRPLPMYPHNKISVTEEEGMEVVRAMGDSPAILLFGHGATTASKTLDGAVIDMFGLEEQAKMNYMAYCAAGPDHPFIPEEMILDGLARRPMEEEPHFIESMKGQRPATKGNWMYYADKVTRQLDRELA